MTLTGQDTVLTESILHIEGVVQVCVLIGSVSQDMLLFQTFGAFNLRKTLTVLA